MEQITRRELVGAGVGLGMTVAAGGLSGWPLEEAMAQPIQRLAENIPTTILGRTQWKSKIIGLGTIFRPETKWTTQESDELFNTLIDNGINLIELGVVYKDSEERLGRLLPKLRRDQLFISSKSTKITKEGFMKQLEASLVKLNTDHLDCYMLHNYSAFVEYDRVMGPGGGFEGLLEAQKQGKTRFIGFTGHGCPVMMAALRSGKFDLFVIPYNAAHREFGRALDLAAKLQAGVLVMKPLGGSGLVKYNAKDPLQLPQTLTVEECLRFVLSHPGARVAIPNMSTMEHVKVALAAAATFKPLTPEEKLGIDAKVARVVGGVCSECQKPCDGACPNKVPVSLLMSRVQEMRRLGYDNRRQGDAYAVLEHDFMDCDGCGKCEGVCPNKFPVRSTLEKYDRTYRESRFRDVLQFEKVYR
jgi:predicted aldo/keto reductase-like oxidoreductase